MNQLDKGEILFNIFIDLSKTFDTIDHYVSVSKLSNRTIRSSNQMIFVVLSVKLKSYRSRTLKYAAPFE